MPLLFAYGKSRFCHDMAQIIAVILLNFEEFWFYCTVMCLNNAEGVAFYKTGPSGAV